MENLQTILTVMNAALEHVPAHTQRILVANAQDAIKALEEIVKKHDEAQVK
jgi:hypothetical protein